MKHGAARSVGEGYPFPYRKSTRLRGRAQTVCLVCLVCLVYLVGFVGLVFLVCLVHLVCLVGRTDKPTGRTKKARETNGWLISLGDE
jgi:uncharacterized metal-binding protein